MPINVTNLINEGIFINNQDSRYLDNLIYFSGIEAENGPNGIVQNTYFSHYSKNFGTVYDCDFINASPGGTGYGKILLSGLLFHDPNDYPYTPRPRCYDAAADSVTTIDNASIWTLSSGSSRSSGDLYYVPFEINSSGRVILENNTKILLGVGGERIEADRITMREGSIISGITRNDDTFYNVDAIAVGFTAEGDNILRNISLKGIYGLFQLDGGRYINSQFNAPISGAMLIKDSTTNKCEFNGGDTENTRIKISDSARFSNYFIYQYSPVAYRGEPPIYEISLSNSHLNDAGLYREAERIVSKTVGVNAYKNLKKKFENYHYSDLQSRFSGCHIDNMILRGSDFYTENTIIASRIQECKTSNSGNVFLQSKIVTMDANHCSNSFEFCDINILYDSFRGFFQNCLFHESFIADYDDIKDSVNLGDIVSKSALDFINSKNLAGCSVMASGLNFRKSYNQGDIGWSPDLQGWADSQCIINSDIKNAGSIVSSKIKIISPNPSALTKADDASSFQMKIIGTYSRDRPLANGDPVGWYYLPFRGYEIAGSIYYHHGNGYFDEYEPVDFFKGTKDLTKLRTIEGQYDYSQTISHNNAILEQLIYPAAIIRSRMLRPSQTALLNRIRDIGSGPPGIHNINVPIIWPGTLIISEGE